MNTTATFQYLNLENRWPRFRLDGLINDGGTLRLADLPAAGAPTGVILPEAVGAFRGPAGLARDLLGNLYLADPTRHRILRVDACDGRTTPLPCLRGPGSEPGQLNTPRGLIAGPRGALYVADSGNHRVQVIDLKRQQVRALWGAVDARGEPVTGTAPGEFDQPWDLAADGDDYIYVVDTGNRRLQKFTPDGTVLPAFWSTMSAQPTVPAHPTYVTVVGAPPEQRLLVIDGTDLLLYAADGTFDAAATARWAAAAPLLVDPVAATAGDGALYVADGGRVLVFDAAGTFVGYARQPVQNVAGLLLDESGNLLLHPGAGGALQQLAPAAGKRICGTFLAGPFSGPPAPETRWQRIQLLGDDLPSETHLQLFTLTSDTLDGSAGHVPTPPLNCSDLSSTAMTPTGIMSPPATDTWVAAPRDAPDLLAQQTTGRYLWLAGLLQGDGAATPRLHQIRVEHNRPSLLELLPGVHTRDPVNRAHLEKVLALFESMEQDAGAALALLPRLFDPHGAPDDLAPEGWLDWLAGWLAVELEEAWPDAKRRDVVARAFAMHARRGTVESLQELVQLYTGAAALIDEPARIATLWEMDAGLLGHDTRLAPAEAQGAVVATTAQMDHSHLIDDEDFGAPLFEADAHHFCVQVYAADVADPAALARVTQLIEREKPAHTTFELCVIEPKLRVGFQARLGIDTIVGGPPPEMVLADGQPLGVDTALPAGKESGGRLDRSTHLGRSTRLA